MLEEIDAVRYVSDLDEDDDGLEVEKILNGEKDDEDESFIDPLSVEDAASEKAEAGMSPIDKDDNSNAALVLIQSELISHLEDEIESQNRLRRKLEDVCRRRGPHGRTDRNNVKVPVGLRELVFVQELSQGHAAAPGLQCLGGNAVEPKDVPDQLPETTRDQVFSPGE